MELVSWKNGLQIQTIVQHTSQYEDRKKGHQGAVDLYQGSTLAERQGSTNKRAGRSVRVTKVHENAMRPRKLLAMVGGGCISALPQLTAVLARDMQLASRIKDALVWLRSTSWTLATDCLVARLSKALFRRNSAMPKNGMGPASNFGRHCGH
jgi:hypothetical protein